MNGSLGRDRVWNDHIWNEIDKAVREEVGRVRVAQKVFPSTVVNNVLPVSMNRAVPFGGKAPPDDPVDDVFQPFFEISTEFVLTQAQVDGEENTHLAASLARLAASTVASTEDAILFLGMYGIPAAVDKKPPAVHVTNQHAIPPGFVAEADNFPA
ncbi:MAG: encapsulin, partial [Terrimicrobium sp.]